MSSNTSSTVTLWSSDTVQTGTTTSGVGALYSQHQSWLVSWLRRQLKCSETAADFAQDTFLRILTSRDTAQQVADIREPRSYLATIANRILIDHIRRNALEKAYLETLSHQPETAEISAEQRLLILEFLQELDAMLNGLGPHIKQAFLLSQLQGMPYADIAVELGVAVVTVKRYMAKATHSCLLYSLQNEL